MAFIQTCIIKKNTPEIRAELENLGYRRFIVFDEDADWISTFIEDDSYVDFCEGEIDPNETIDDYGIDCGENEELFYAIAALRDDNDLNQYFVLHCNLAGLDDPAMIKYKAGSLIKCNRERWNIDVDENGNPLPFSSRNIPAHKATVDELINYFR